MSRVAVLDGRLAPLPPHRAPRPTPAPRSTAMDHFADEVLEVVEFRTDADGEPWAVVITDRGEMPWPTSLFAVAVC